MTDIRDRRASSIRLRSANYAGQVGHRVSGIGHRASGIWHLVYDVLIIGAGPAGSAAAITLSKLGRSVLLIDRFSFPREKICGDGLTGDSLRMLKKLGIWTEIESAAYKSSKVEIFPSDRLSCRKSFILESPVYTLKRELFDKILLDYALQCGSEFYKSEFTGRIEQNKDCSSFEVMDSDKGETYWLKARYAVLSTGCRFSAAVNPLSLIRPDLIGVRGYCRAEWEIKHPMVFFEKKLRNGYFWIFPMGNSEYNVGYGTTAYQRIDLKKKLYKFISGKFPDRELSEQWLSSVKGAFLRTNLINADNAVDNNMLLAGEVLGSTFPFTGEGIGKALETGIMAAENVGKALTDNNISVLQEYSDRIKNELQLKYRPYRIASFVMKTKLLNKIFLALLIRSRKLCYITSQILNDKADGEAFTLRGILKYIFKGC
jgi:menaquinone-9 beta-reductase